MPSNQYVCRICGNSQGNRIYKVKEMMFGFKDEFIYFECANCGALQIAEIPKDLGKYYPKDYYSFNLGHINFLKRFLWKLASYLIWNYKNINSYLIWNVSLIIFRNSKLASIGMVEGINKTSRILDVGCGKGELLFILRDIGFKNLYGIDPYIERDIVEDNVVIWKRTIHEVPLEQKFDLIMFHHSLEHIDDQLETLKHAKHLLSEGGTILVRMPIKSEFIWKKYKTNWVQIDAPRHLIIHTLKSFKIMVNKVGLKIENIIFDSTGFQFWGSELYKKGIPLVEGSKKLNKYFNKEQLKEWGKKAKELNHLKQGDQAIFYLKK